MSPSQDDQHATFVAYYARHSDSLRAYVLAMIQNRDLAEDVIQEVAVTLFERFGAFDSSRPFLPWARGVARFKIMEAWRRSSARPQISLSSEALDGIDSAWSRLDQRQDDGDEVAALDHCLQQLGKSGRRLIQLRYFDAWPIDQIAQQVNKSVAAVTKTLSRLRGGLHECVSRQLKELPE